MSGNHTSIAVGKNRCHPRETREISIHLFNQWMQRIMGNISVEQNDPCLFRLAATFSSDQIDCICEALYQARDGAKLLELFQPNVHNVMFYRCRYYSSSVLRAYLYTLYYSKRYEELFQAPSNTFEQRFYSELQDLWYKARYAENEERRQKELGAVEKYRLRKKHPPPRSIWDGQETIYSFKENARKKNKYPTLEDKKEIARITDLKIIQISNWFKNRRQRDKSSSTGQFSSAVPIQFDSFNL
uniref:Homeobox domain-containing protein n=1 Tax=Onchocerca volvulus TaxID=6282 RepID=A0A8R1XXI4_ONCVO